MPTWWQQRVAPVILTTSCRILNQINVCLISRGKPELFLYWIILSGENKSLSGQFTERKSDLNYLLAAYGGNLINLF